MYDAISQNNKEKQRSQSNGIEVFARRDTVPQHKCFKMAPECLFTKVDAILFGTAALFTVNQCCDRVILSEACFSFKDNSNVKIT